MKNHVSKSLLGLAIVAFTLNSCELFDTADDFTFEVVLNKTFVINEQFDSQGNPVTYVDGDTWDPNTDAEFLKYKDKIKSVKVDKVTYTVTDYSAQGDVTFSNGKGTFKASAQGQTIAAAGITMQSVMGSQGVTSELNYAIADLDNVGKHLKDVGPVEFEVSGTFSKTPVAFKVPVKMYLTITAEAL